MIQLLSPPFSRTCITVIYMIQLLSPPFARTCITVLYMIQLLSPPGVLCQGYFSFIFSRVSCISVSPVNIKQHPVPSYLFICSNFIYLQYNSSHFTFITEIKFLKLVKIFFVLFLGVQIIIMNFTVY